MRGAFPKKLQVAIRALDDNNDQVQVPCLAPALPPPEHSPPLEPSTPTPLTPMFLGAPKETIDHPTVTPASPRLTLLADRDLIDPVNLLFDLHQGGIDAALLVASLLPKVTCKALHKTCRAGRKLILQYQHTMATSLIVKLNMDCLPGREIGTSFSKVTALHAQTDFGIWRAPEAALQYLLNTCPILMAQLRSLTVEQRCLTTGDPPHWNVRVCKQLLHSCTSLRQLHVYDIMNQAWSITLQLPEQSFGQTVEVSASGRKPHNGVAQGCKASHSICRDFKVPIDACKAFVAQEHTHKCTGKALIYNGLGAGEPKFCKASARATAAVDRDNRGGRCMSSTTVGAGAAEGLVWATCETEGEDISSVDNSVAENGDEKWDPSQKAAPWEEPCSITPDFSSSAGNLSCISAFSSKNPGNRQSDDGLALETHRLLRLLSGSMDDIIDDSDTDRDDDDEIFAHVLMQADEDTPPLTALLLHPAAQRCVSHLDILWDVHPIEDLEIHEVICGASNLQQLSLRCSSSGDVNQEHLRDTHLPEMLMVSPLQHLTSFQLLGKLDLEPEIAWVNAIAMHTGLQELQLHAAMFPRFMQLPHLTQLEFTVPPAQLFTEAHLNVEGLGNLHQLQVLKLWDTAVHEGLRAVLVSLQHLPNLHSLHLLFPEHKLPTGLRLQEELKALKEPLVFDPTTSFRQHAQIDRSAEHTYVQGQGERLTPLLPPKSVSLPALQHCVLGYHSSGEFFGDSTASEDLPWNCKWVDDPNVSCTLQSLHAPKLTTLESVHPQIFITFPLLRSLLSTSPSLQVPPAGSLGVLIDGGPMLIDAAATMPQLFAHSHIIFQNISHGDLAHLAETPSLTTTLQHLDLSSADVLQASEATLHLIVASFPKLKTLGLKADQGCGACKAFSSRAVMRVVSGMLPMLEVLRLGECTELEDALFEVMVAKCSQLRCLVLDGLEGVSERALLGLAQMKGGGRKLEVKCKRHNLSHRGLRMLQQHGWEVELRG